MSRLLVNLAVILRIAGLTVVELDGWQQRGRRHGSGYEDDRPWCVMWHHTASKGYGAPDADYVTFVAKDRPICNILIGRDGVVYVCAAGPTNTNGSGHELTFSKGTVPANEMNLYAVGMEISNDGVGQHYPAVQIDACFAASNAINAAYGNEPDDVAGHHDYTSRKIDPARADAVDEYPWRPHSVNASGSWSLHDLRAECRRRSQPTPPHDTPEEFKHMLYVIQPAFDGSTDDTEWLVKFDDGHLERALSSTIAYAVTVGLPIVAETSEEHYNYQLARRVLPPMPVGA